MVNDRSSKNNPLSSKSEVSPHSLAHTVLFEQYRLLLMKQTALLLLNRVIAFAIVGFIMISPRLSFVQACAAVFISVVVTNIWLYERRVGNSQTQALADDLARQSGKGELDFYIRSEYNVDRKTSPRALAAYEPQAWFLLTLAFAIFQYTFGPLLLR